MKLGELKRGTPPPPQLILAVISDERCLTKAGERKPGRWLGKPPNYKIEFKIQ